jgi:hypothetical protein
LDGEEAHRLHVALLSFFYQQRQKHLFYLQIGRGPLSRKEGDRAILRAYVSLGQLICGSGGL